MNPLNTKDGDVEIRDDEISETKGYPFTQVVHLPNTNNGSLRPEDARPRSSVLLRTSTTDIATRTNSNN